MRSRRINGHTLYSQDLSDLKTQRDIANEFMRKATQFVIGQLKMRTEEVGKNANHKARQQQLGLYAVLRNGLVDKLQRLRYFGGGSKLDDLVDFLPSANQADRLRHLPDRRRDPRPRGGGAVHASPQMQQMTQWSPQAAEFVHRELRNGGFHNANYNVLLRALTDEFRVRMARLALEKGAGPALQLARNASATATPQLEAAHADPHAGDAGGNVPVLSQGTATGAEIALIPVDVARVSSIRCRRRPGQNWKCCSRKAGARRYDPASLEPGFQLPEQAQVSWVTVDPKSKFYNARGAGRHDSPGHAPGPVRPDAAAGPRRGRLCRAVGGVGRLADAELRGHPQTAPENYEVAGLGTPYFLLPLFKKGLAEPKATSVVALGSAAARSVRPRRLALRPRRFLGDERLPAGRLPGCRVRNSSRLSTTSGNGRLPIGATMVLSGAFLRSWPPAWPRWPLRPRNSWSISGRGRPGRAARQPVPAAVDFRVDECGPPRPSRCSCRCWGRSRRTSARIETKLAEDWAQEIFREVKTRLDTKAGGAALTRGAVQESSPSRLPRRPHRGLHRGLPHALHHRRRPRHGPAQEVLRGELPERERQGGPDRGRGHARAGRLRPAVLRRPAVRGRQHGAVQPQAVAADRPRRTPTALERPLRGKEAGEQTSRLWDSAQRPGLPVLERPATRPSQPPADLDAVRAEVERAWSSRRRGRGWPRGSGRMLPTRCWRRRRSRTLTCWPPSAPRPRS